MAPQAGGGEALSAGPPRVTLLPAGGLLAGISPHPATTAFGGHPVVPEKPAMWRIGPVGGNGRTTSAGPPRRPMREDRRPPGSRLSEPARCCPGARNPPAPCSPEAGFPTMPQHAGSSRSAPATPACDHDSQTVRHPSQADQREGDPPSAHSPWDMVRTSRNVRPAHRRIPEPRRLPPAVRIIQPAEASRPQASQRRARSPSRATVRRSGPRSPGRGTSQHAHPYGPQCAGTPPQRAGIKLPSGPPLLGRRPVAQCATRPTPDSPAAFSTR